MNYACFKVFCSRQVHAKEELFVRYADHDGVIKTGCNGCENATGDAICEQCANAAAKMVRENPNLDIGKVISLEKYM